MSSFQPGALRTRPPFSTALDFLKSFGAKLYATIGTADFLRNSDIEATVLHWPLEQKSPNTIEFLMERKIDLVINIPKNYREDELTNDYIIRRRAVDLVSRL